MTTGRRNSGPRGRGFTLLELVVVLVVVSVVLAISAPSLRGFFASRQSADAATTIMSLTKCARSEAVSQGSLCRLNVDASTGTFWLTVQRAGTFVSPDGEMGRRFQAPEGASVCVQSDPPGPVLAYVQFYPTGRSDVATIEVRGRQGEVFRVVCPSATEPFRVISPAEAP